MVISALKNLSATENDAVLSEMLAAGDKYFFFPRVFMYFILHFNNENCFGDRLAEADGYSVGVEHLEVPQ